MTSGALGSRRTVKNDGRDSGEDGVGEGGGQARTNTGDKRTGWSSPWWIMTWSPEKGIDGKPTVMRRQGEEDEMEI